MSRCIIIPDPLPTPRLFFREHVAPIWPNDPERQAEAWPRWVDAIQALGRITPEQAKTLKGMKP